MILVGQRGALAGGPGDDQRVHALLDLPIDHPPEGGIVDALRRQRGDQRRRDAAEYRIPTHVHSPSQYCRIQKQPMRRIDRVPGRCRPPAAVNPGGATQLIHSAPHTRQSNGCCPFAQRKLALSLFGSGPFQPRQRLCDAFAPVLLMTTAPLSFNCNIQLMLCYHKKAALSIACL